MAFLGGNGHASVRLDAAREALRRAGGTLEIVELAYPRTEGFEAFLDELAREAARFSRSHPGSPVYATGIGALVALALRARGALLGHPLIVQGGVLWGLERRWFPRLMRLPGMARLLAAAFRLPLVRRRFARRHLRAALAPAELDAFFAGYGDAGAFAAWFRWLSPALLRRLERELRATPGALSGIEAWWGAGDTVVGVEELRATERALGIEVPLRVFPAWGHYPMLDDPHGWALEVWRAVEAAHALP